MKLPLLAALTFVTLSAQAQQQRPAITGVAFVRVYTADPAASQIFYGKTLGFDATAKDSLTHYQVNDAQWIEVAPMPTPAPVSKVACFGLTTRDVRAMERYLRARHIPIEEPLANGKFAIHDPEGHLIYFVQQTPAGPEPSPRAPSHRLIHTGFNVKDREVESKFFHDILGFNPLWFGGRSDDIVDWVSLQVPDGRDWVEFMLHPPADNETKSLGSRNHIALGVANMPDTLAAVARNGCTDATCSASKPGRDGKLQLNLFDPDLTRTEYMEFTPSTPTCCSPFTAKPPTEKENR